MAMLITPQNVGLTGAVLEIAELPPGKVLATMEGQLVDRIVRLDDGRVLIELPGTLDRPTMLNVRVSQ